MVEMTYLDQNKNLILKFSLQCPQPKDKFGVFIRDEQENEHLFDTDIPIYKVCEKHDGCLKSLLLAFI